MTIDELTPEVLAAKFSELLRAHLTKKQMAAVISRNRRELSPQICHSHDFCDANVVMDDAFEKLIGKTACDTGGGEDAQQSGGCMSDQALELWNAAWVIARKNEFKS